MSTRIDYDVLVAGAGPVGLMLAVELQLAGTRVLVVERREELDTAVKAEGINAASAEAFDRRGLLPALLALHRPFTNTPESVGSERRRFAGHFGGIQVPADPVDDDDPALRDRGPAGWGPLQPGGLGSPPGPAGRGGADPRAACRGARRRAPARGRRARVRGGLGRCHRRTGRQR
jgi:choline dehydrogenase-like flavoprotein